MKHNRLAIQQLFTCSQETRRSSRKRSLQWRKRSRKMRRLHLIFLLHCVQSTLSERCCAVKEVSSRLLPSMAGRYLLIGHSSALTTVQARCKTGCVYTKEDETGPEATQYCFEASTGGKTICSGLEGSCPTGKQGGLLSFLNQITVQCLKLYSKWK